MLVWIWSAVGWVLFFCAALYAKSLEQRVGRSHYR